MLWTEGSQSAPTTSSEPSRIWRLDSKVSYKRSLARFRHVPRIWENHSKDKERAYTTAEGSPFLPLPGSEAANRVLPEGTPNLAGSFMIYNMSSLDEAWERVKSDVYWTNKVWDQEKLAIWPLLS
jgi:hypothetical protein